MESSISHCFNITGWRKYAHQRIKFSTVVKLGGVLQHHDAVLDFWDRLIRQGVIKIDSSNVVCE